LKNKLPFAVFLLLVRLAPGPAAQESAPDEGLIVLPEAEVVERQETTEYLTRETMEREGSPDLWEALRNVPGVIRDGGGGMRNESNFTVRGMDERMMPVFIDGVPLAAPYRGEADNARFLTADLEDVEIQKGYSSMLLGSNTLGGAVIMRTARPKKQFELFHKSAVDFDGVFSYGGIVNTFGFGSKLDAAYGKLVLQIRNVDHTRLSDQFVPDPLNIQQKGDRLFSGSRDLKFTALAGWTPAGPFSVNASYILQDADKGVSPEEVEGTQTVYSVWTLWRRQTISLDAVYDDETLSGKVLLFLDKFDNTLASATSVEEVAEASYSDPSTYDDYSAGFRLEAAYRLTSRDALRGAFTFKQDGHRDDKDGLMTKEIRENTFSAGAEYESVFFSPLTLAAGLGADYFAPAYLWSINSLAQSAGAFIWSAQAGLFLDLGPNHRLHYTFAKKNHIPTMRMRYSETLMDSSAAIVPNPGLKPEEALNNELGYRGGFAFKGGLYLSVNAAAYCNYLYNMLAEETTLAGIRRINADKTLYYGFEAGFSFFTSRYFSAGGAASINRYSISYSIEGYNAIGNYPAASANAWIEVKPFAGFGNPTLASLALIPGLEYEGRRYGSSRFVNVNAANVLEAFCLFSLKIAFDVGDNFSFHAAVRNLGDANYYLQDGALPMPGRSFTLGFEGNY
jgi:iron complex outermembrane receptor protein